MSIFGNIMSGIFSHGSAKVQPTSTGSGASGPTSASSSAPAATSASAPPSQVDVEAVLSKLASALVVAAVQADRVSGALIAQYALRERLRSREICNAIKRKNGGQFLAGIRVIRADPGFFDQQESRFAQSRPLKPSALGNSR